MAKELTIEQLIACGLEQSTASDLLQRMNPFFSSLPPPECWQKMTQEVLTPDHPFALHKLLHETVFSDWDSTQGPPPAWFPAEEQMQTTNIAELMRALKLNSYEALHAWSARHRADFWEVMMKRLGIRFKQGFTQVVDLSHGVESPQWLVSAKLNIADSCFNAPDDAIAIVFQQEGGALSTLTYKALNSLTNRVANALMDAGLLFGGSTPERTPGDAIAVDMPMIPESVAIYLGIIKAGGVVVSIADSFAPHEIETRLRLGCAKAIFTQDYILRAGGQLPLYAKVVSANAPKAIVLSCRDKMPSCSTQLRDGDVTWNEFLNDNNQFNSLSCHPHDYTNILFSSGTTGEPKAIPWTQTTPIKCAADGHLHQDIQPGDVVAWPTNLGWMMGPWLIYASLINKATIALYDGAPTGRGFGKFVQDAHVNMLGVVPSLVKTWKSTGCMKGLDWRAIKGFSSTGECSNPEDMLFLMSLAGYRPIIEYCGGTEIGGGYITGTLAQPAAPATFSTPALGLDFVILDDDGHPTDKGELFLIPPSIGLSTELLNKDHHEVYFEGTPQGPQGEVLRRHGDGVERLGSGYHRMHGRVDDTMNLAGIKVSSAEIERVLNAVNGISETAAIAVSPPEGGPSLLVIYAVLSPGNDMEKDALKTALQAAIKERLNPLFKIRDMVIVDALPRTASNKVMRRMLRDRYSATISIDATEISYPIVKT
jgi:acetyl-CoA synthetase